MWKSVKNGSTLTLQLETTTLQLETTIVCTPQVCTPTKQKALIQRRA
jgi:hypothetical protein